MLSARFRRPLLCSEVLEIDPREEIGAKTECYLRIAGHPPEINLLRIIIGTILAIGRAYEHVAHRLAWGFQRDSVRDRGQA